MARDGYSTEIIDQAEIMYLNGDKNQHICESLGIERLPTISDWAKKYGWVKNKEETLKDIALRQIKRIEKLTKKLEEYVDEVNLKELKPAVLLDLYLKSMANNSRLIQTYRPSTQLEKEKEVEEVFE
jgi:uncharacterized protein YjcR